MKVLMFSTDDKILDPRSVVAGRILSYGDKVDALAVIVFTKKASGPVQLSDKVTVWATGGHLKVGRLWLGYCLGKKQLADVVTAQDPFLVGLVAWLIARYLSVPLELQVHTDLFSSDFKSSSFGHWWRAQLARFLLPKAASVRVVSERIRSSIARARVLLQRPAVVLPIFVDTRNLREGKPLYNLHDRYPQFTKIILMVGRLTREKNYPLAFEVLRSSLKSEPKLGLVIAGTGPEQNRLIALAKSLGLDRHIIFLGWQTDLLSLYKTADVFLHTSRYEGYGLVLAEAAAAGLPVVSRPVGIMSEALGWIGESAEELAGGVLRAEAKDFIPNDFADFKTYAGTVTSLWRSLI